MWMKGWMSWRSTSCDPRNATKTCTDKTGWSVSIHSAPWLAASNEDSLYCTAEVDSAEHLENLRLESAAGCCKKLWGKVWGKTSDFACAFRQAWLDFSPTAKLWSGGWQSCVTGIVRHPRTWSNQWYLSDVKFQSPNVTRATRALWIASSLDVNWHPQ